MALIQIQKDFLTEKGLGHIKCIDCRNAYNPARVDAGIVLTCKCLKTVIASKGKPFVIPLHGRTTADLIVSHPTFQKFVCSAKNK